MILLLLTLHLLAAVFWVGGIAPLVSAALLTSFHKSWVPVAIYMTLMSLISFVEVQFAPETLNRDLTLEHDA